METRKMGEREREKRPRKNADGDERQRQDDDAEDERCHAGVFTRTSPRVPMGRLAHPWLFGGRGGGIPGASATRPREETDRVLRCS